MHLARALGVSSADEIDANRSLRLGPFELSPDAAIEAIRILTAGEARHEVKWQHREFMQPIYWSIEHYTKGQVELFGIPKIINSQLPTAIEIALVKTIAAIEPEYHASIFSGGVEIAIGPFSACEQFREIIGVKNPLVGQSLLFGGANQAVIHDDIDALLTNLAQKCFANSFNTSPLKFRFLEIYRVIEARFISDVKAKLIKKFDEEPGNALREAQESLKAEINQIIGLAETQKDAFESCWLSLHQIKNNNRFSAALFRRLETRKLQRKTQWESGAALIYQIRCAIVHSGDKDLIFESFPDGDFAIESVMKYVERAALLLVGITLT